MAVDHRITHNRSGHPMPQCILHIGTAKTGTKSIQQLLAARRGALSSQGILYPYAGTINKRGGHHCLAWHYGGTLSTRCNLCADSMTSKSLEEEFRSSQYKRMIISSEEFSALSFNSEALSRLESDMQSLRIEPTVVVYIREQAAFFNSYYTEIVMALETVDDFTTFIQKIEGEARYDYRNWLAGFEQRFAVRVRPFDKFHLIRGDLIADFLFCAGVAFPVGQTSAGHANMRPRVIDVSIHLEAAKRISMINANSFNFKRKVRETLQESLADMSVDEHLDRAFWGFSEKHLAFIRDHYKKVNMKTALHFGLPQPLFSHFVTTNENEVHFSSLPPSLRNKVDIDIFKPLGLT